ncbi:phosphotransferase [Paenisporosarcina sp. TG20]|uniref:phosphotransferase n=1 Tax=Paenisporosarcina sp. TG20 TaxID=1211706 RepID=UPI001ED8DDEC|nr:phosphotransferase [Paenisporosarcina sp. TG20]
MWKWQIGPHAYSLKKYDIQSDADKIRYIHEEITKVNTNLILPIEPYSNPYMIKQPWIESGRKVQFNKAQDRIKSLDLLHQLHDTRKQIDWQKSPYFQEINLIRKWTHRLEKWERYEKFLHKTLGPSKTQKITQLARTSLAQLSPISNKKLTILHGDVVHHNFVRDNKDRIYLIDFDLACLGPAEVELILWSHRVLPHYNYDLPTLIREHPSLRKVDWSYLLFPNELMREWLYASTLSDVQLRLFLPKLKAFTDKALLKMPQLWDDYKRLK